MRFRYHIILDLEFSFNLNAALLSIEDELHFKFDTICLGIKSGLLRHKSAKDTISDRRRDLQSHDLDLDYSSIDAHSG